MNASGLPGTGTAIGKPFAPFEGAMQGAPILGVHEPNHCGCRNLAIL